MSLTMKDIMMANCAIPHAEMLTSNHCAALARELNKTLAAAPVPPAGGEVDIPDYFVAACDKFDWTPEEALRFYAEGKHFDTVDGRTRILCTGAIASHALKGMGGEYADMKGMEPAGGEVEVLAWATAGPDPVFPGKTIHHLWGRRKDAELHINSTGHEEGWGVHELVDRAHVTRLQAEVDSERLQSRIYAVQVNEFRDERDDLKAEVERLNELLAKEGRHFDAVWQKGSELQSDLTKARELLRWFYAHANVHQVGTVMMDSARDFLAHQSAPAAKDGSDE